MKKYSCAFISILLSIGTLHAQVDTGNKPNNVNALLLGKIPGLSIIKSDTSKPKPYFQTQIAVNGKLVGRGNICINPADIDAIVNIENAKNDSAAFRKYGLKNADVVEITMKPGAKLFSLDEILHQYHIFTGGELPVFVDGRAIKNRKLFIASADYIQSVRLDGDEKIEITSKKVIVVGFGKSLHIDNNPVCTISRPSFFHQYAKK